MAKSRYADATKAARRAATSAHKAVAASKDAASEQGAARSPSPLVTPAATS